MKNLLSTYRLVTLDYTSTISILIPNIGIHDTMRKVRAAGNPPEIYRNINRNLWYRSVATCGGNDGIKNMSYALVHF